MEKELLKTNIFELKKKINKLNEDLYSLRVVCNKIINLINNDEDKINNDEDKINNDEDKIANNQDKILFENNNKNFVNGLKELAEYNATSYCDFYFNI